jgi:hypothetical protein
LQLQIKKNNVLQRIGGPIKGGILIAELFQHSIVDKADEKGFFCWDIHRIFFYAMKVFVHALENWVSESKLGFVLNEEEIKSQFEPEHYYTTV